MNYIEKQMMYYTIFCSEILNKPFEQILKKLSPLFACSTDEYDRVCKLLRNNDFLKLRSIQAIVMRINFINSFCNDVNVFGMKKDERDSLSIKKAVYGIITELRKDFLSSNDLKAVVARLFEQDNKFALLYALVLYCQDIEMSKVISILKKSIREGNIDAMIVTLFFIDNEQRKNLIAEMKRKDIVFLYGEVFSRIIDTYERYGDKVNKKGENNNAE